MAHLYSVHKVAGGDISLIFLIVRLLCCNQRFPLSQEAAAGRQETNPHSAFLERYYFLLNFSASSLHLNFKLKALCGVQTPASPWRQLIGPFWGLGSLLPSLLTLPDCGCWVQWCKCEASLTALRTLGSNQEVTVDQSPLGALGRWREERGVCAACWLRDCL